MDIQDLIFQLTALALRPHYACDDNYYNCPMHNEETNSTHSYDDIVLYSLKCKCGASEHNKRVMDLYERLNNELEENDKAR